ncbi:MAG: hypothetical protein R2822_07570 [Spirosomataceae bacterium]
MQCELSIQHVRLLGDYNSSATNGDKYGISKGNTYTGPAYASATAVPGTLPANIKTNISHAADSTWTIRVFNKANDCFKDTTVTVKALVKDATVTVANGFPPAAAMAQPIPLSSPSRQQPRS